MPREKPIAWQQLALQFFAFTLLIFIEQSGINAVEVLQEHPPMPRLVLAQDGGKTYQARHLPQIHRHPRFN